MSRIGTIYDQVKESVTSAEASDGHSTKDAIVATLVGQAMREREGILMKGLEDLQDLKKKLKAIAPDASTFEVLEDGQTVRKDAWSKKGLEELKKAQDRVAKLTALVEKVLEEPTNENYAKLKQFKA